MAKMGFVKIKFSNEYDWTKHEHNNLVFSFVVYVLVKTLRLWCKQKKLKEKKEEEGDEESPQLPQLNLMTIRPFFIS